MGCRKDEISTGDVEAGKTSLKNITPSGYIQKGTIKIGAVIFLSLRKNGSGDCRADLSIGGDGNESRPVDH